MLTAQVLPPLRDDLTITEGQLDESGEPTWLIYDSLRHRHYRIDAVAHELLSVWIGCGTIDDLVRSVSARGNSSIESSDVASFIAFLKQNKLCSVSEDGAWHALDAEGHYLRHSIIASAFHNYLFFRIPLWKPQPFLAKWLHVVRNIATRRFFLSVAGLGLIGLYLVTRQWESFVSTFQYAFQWEGILSALICLTLVKACHEMAHAFAATHYGCRVPSMGIGFMMLTPLLYADVSDVWRLKSRRQRAVVSLAGVFAELVIASLALFSWSFLAEGPLRSAAFFVAVVSLATSLLVNLNPFMRFDGYHLLSDILGVDNLQDRSFALARWKLRELLFKLGRPCPEMIPARLRQVLIVFACATWMYRFALFLGIALLVYHYFFKALGIALFVMEIGYFILWPIWAEARHWWNSRLEIAQNRRWVCTSIGGLLVLIGAFVPWSNKVEVPAIVEPREIARIFPSRSGVLKDVRVRHGQAVEAGQVLVELQSPELEKEVSIVKIQIRTAHLQYARRLADETDREASMELERRISGLQRKLHGLEIEKKELQLYAPIGGILVEFNPDLHAGRWINPREFVGTIASRATAVARGYIAETDLARIEAGTGGVFYPEASQIAPIKSRVTDIALAGAKEIEIVDLVSLYGGRVGVQLDERRRHLPVVAQYPVRFELNASSQSVDLIRRGVMVVSGKSESFATRVFWRVTSVLIRESGF